MILGNPSYNRSPVPTLQSFIWVADYYDGTSFLEYDSKTKKNNSYYEIEKDKLIYFGLIGEGSQVYFDVANGIFQLNSHRIMISYKTDNQEYPLTGRTFLYNDIIQYKDSSSDANILNKKEQGNFDSRIEQYNIGYKKQMYLVDANINFQCILTIPFKDSPYLQIKITSDKDLDGKIVIRTDGIVTEELHAPLKENMSGNLNWIIR
ncbi:hypothetical protein [Paenibacillus sp. 1781tsa1]|uniref:hypothetical protein n=1 Tax=Paenibacillus sp. 1781tsa1 TaxID=2953810 RepID=UPI00209DFB6E|nr:hypothetical protein [Paenibacillus sp. 1781tsa1]MCP1185115.1 hypothetical protein [Paenibacillus sp. 1781tsa1]